MSEDVTNSRSVQELTAFVPNDGPRSSRQPFPTQSTHFLVHSVEGKGILKEHQSIKEGKIERKLATERRGEISLRLQVGEIRRVSLRAKPEKEKARESIREERKDLVAQSEEEDWRV